MSTIITPPPRPHLPIRDSATTFPVGRIFCIGRNYADHAKEMGAAAEPIFFMKPADSVTTDSSLAYPNGTNSLHHEVELVLALGDDAEILAYGVGLDLTKRDLQGQMKAKGAPWEIGKAFEQSAVLAPLALDAPPQSGRIALSVNGQERQSGNLDQMILPPQALLDALSKHFTLKPGDLVFTGTPAGVGELNAGDQVEAAIDGLPPLTLTIE